MISASMAYNILSGNMKQSLDRVAAQATVKRDAEYYKDNINKVKDVDDFLGNYRLYSYAMKAYGLDDMTYAKAFMKKVLESDLTDADSFANKLTDTRYKEFAAAFNFNSPAADAQSDAQEDDLIGLYTQSFADESKNATTETDYYSNAIDAVQDVSDIVSNSRVRTYVLKAYGIDPTYVSKDFLTQVLTSDVNDPNSFVNVSGNDKYKALAAQFNFNADGTVSGAAQTTAQKNAVMEQYNLTVPSIATPAAADYNKAYYLSKIGTITNVSDLVADSRLASYIKTAFSMGDLSNAALKLVLTDSNYANTLGYGEAYSAFNFNADGTIDSTAASYTAQTSDQIDAMADMASAASSYYQSKIVTITNVDDLIADPRLTRFIKDAYGMPQTLSDADLKSVLTDTTYASTLGYDNVPAAFNFLADGTVSDIGVAQTTAQARSTNSGANANLDYFQSKIGAISNVDQLIADQKLTSLIKSVYRMPADTSDADLKSILTDPSFASAQGFTSVNQAFSFASDGSAAAASGPQSAEQQMNTTDSYAVRYDDAQQEAIDAAVANYKERMSDDNIKKVDDFLRSNATADLNKKNDDLPDPYQMALRAYGLTEQDVPRSTLRKLLKSDPYDPNSYVASFKDERITNLVRAFNFGSDGKITSEVQALSPAVMAKYATNYKSRATMGMSDGSIKDKASKDATTAVDNFAKGMAEVKSLDDFLTNDKLTSFVLKANGLDPTKYDEETLRKIFTSDPSDPKSYLNTKADSKLKEIVADFNFDTEGDLTRAKIGAVQNVGAEDRTQQSYLQQTLETQQGESNDGVRLALYFARKAPDITSLYTILGDKALFQVITTTYSLPSGISSMDVEKQVDLLKKFVNLDDLQDSKKVDKLMKRFTAMYDLQNSSSNSPALTILTGGTSS
ncbi:MULTISPECIES: DUF1217 domain-containing protein [unclassified Rhizobium]|uniref:DUF1217 domain-containing protein n=1 Tax=unclassified Rhizobium TaxID=2613769 RepID=UPI00104EABDA|nr:MULTISPECIES: DUF1217 domain-containing protein [unclassified Rhizobium]MBB3394137.1 hypothetical protein [Rhizobium sp. BK060]MBB4168121.1 hypothetical protein [Rhizobium sp. BK538]TCM80818.1 uncharacterized protein DUF1217 [Rhizobium sp. BK068]